jgi:GxxExxY protein
VDERVVVELKAKEKINENDKIQLRKYMRYLGVKRGLLINFGKGGRGVLQFVTMTIR